MFKPSTARLSELKQRYGEPQRHYHTWQHIEALLKHFAVIEKLMADPSAVLWALYWHDAVYDPQAGDNEDKSADLLNEIAKSELPEDSLQRADRIIRATKQHLIPNGLSQEEQTDLALFLDIDLSILAAPRNVFDAYETQIRNEYEFVPEPIYVQARNAILKGFLNRERIYFTDHFHNQWDENARSNLHHSIEILTAKERDNG